MSLDPNDREQLKGLITTSHFKDVEFYDVAKLMADPEGFGLAVRAMDNLCEELIEASDDDALSTCEVKIASPEARGFVFGAAIAFYNDTGIVMLRKPDKLPSVAAEIDFGKEYGKDRLQIPTGAIESGDKVLIVDDLIATGGTPEAAAKLLEMAGAKVVGIVALIELVGLGARERLDALGYPLRSVLQYQA